MLLTIELSLITPLAVSLDRVSHSLGWHQNHCVTRLAPSKARICNSWTQTLHSLPPGIKGLWHLASLFFSLFLFSLTYVCLSGLISHTCNPNPGSLFKKHIHVCNHKLMWWHPLVILTLFGGWGRFTSSLAIIKYVLKKEGKEGRKEKLPGVEAESSLVYRWEFQDDTEKPGLAQIYAQTYTHIVKVFCRDTLGSWSW